MTPDDNHPAAPHGEVPHRLSRRAWLAVAGIAALAGAGTAWWRSRLQPVADPALDRLWTTPFDTLTGPPLRLADWRGQRLVVNFWATWCPPCVEELPMLDAFFRAQKNRGWQVVGLAVDQPAAVQRFLQTMPLGFPVGMAGLAGTELTRSLGNTTGGLPFTVVLGPAGEVVQRKLGKLGQSDLQAWESL